MIASLALLYPELTVGALFGFYHILQYIYYLTVILLVNFVNFEVSTTHPMMHLNSAIKTIAVTAFWTIMTRSCFHKCITTISCRTPTHIISLINDARYHNFLPPKEFNLSNYFPYFDLMTLPLTLNLCFICGSWTLNWMIVFIYFCHKIGP